MSKTNCINCGHGKDPDEIKCPFCGTTYFDMTGIELNMNKPVVLMLRDQMSKSIIHMLAYPTTFSIDMSIGNTTCDVEFEGYRRNTKIFRPEPDVSCRLSLRSK